MSLCETFSDHIVFYLIIWPQLIKIAPRTPIRWSTVFSYMNMYVIYIWLSLVFTFQLKWNLCVEKYSFKKKILLLFDYFSAPLLFHTYTLYLFQILCKVKSLAYHCFSHLMVNLKSLSLEYNIHSCIEAKVHMPLKNPITHLIILSQHFSLIKAYSICFSDWNVNGD